MLLVAKFFVAVFFVAVLSVRCRSDVVAMLLRCCRPPQSQNRDALGLRAYYALESNSCQRPIRSTGPSAIEIDSLTKTRADSALDS